MPTRLRCWFEGDNITFYARVANLSEGGLFLRTSTPLPQGTRALLRMQVEDSGELTAPVTVVWRREHPEAGGPAGMGLRFDSLEPEDRERLRRIISREARASGLGL